MRDAPSIALVTALEDSGARVRAFDPAAMEQARPLAPNVTFCDDPYSSTAGAEALVIVTEWDAFRALDLDRLKREMAAPVLVDLRNVYRPDEFRRRGFTSVSVGRR